MDKEQRIWNLLAKSLSGEASETEQNELEELLRNKPSWYYAYEMLSQWWPAGMEEPGKETIEQRLKSLRERLDDEKPLSDFSREKTGEISLLPTREYPVYQQKSWKKWLLAATVLVLLAMAGWLFFYSPQHSPIINNDQKYAGNGKSEITTRYGSKTKITLPDGTTVWINSGSRLVYDNNNFGVENREVTLVGEGFFDVSHDVAHPFIIHAGKVNIKVLGTAFDVKSYPEDEVIETTLIRGSIEVIFRNDPQKKVVLRPHQKLTVFKDDRMITQNLNAIDQDKAKEYEISPMTIIPADSTVVETSWVQNKLAFRSETFADLAVQMERWYNVKINFSDSKVKQYRFTGIFMNESLDQALKALQITAPFHYRIEKNEVFISKP